MNEACGSVCRHEVNCHASRNESCQAAMLKAASEPKLEFGNAAGHEPKEKAYAYMRPENKKDERSCLGHQIS